MTDSEISDNKKVEIASDFIIHSPPGEFNEVFNDVRSLLNNDNLLKDKACSAFIQHNKDQLTPVRLDGAELSTIVCDFNDLGNSRFFDPRAKQSFHFDPLRKEAADIKPHDSCPASAERYRSALQEQVDRYVTSHFKQPTAAVFAVQKGAETLLHVCVEAHQFQPKNFWNGRWRAVWTITVSSSGPVQLSGVLRVQVHYYEEGNVQLVSYKNVTDSVVASNESQVAKEVIKVISNAETEYQAAICENYQTMSDTTFKALRRQLPVTRSKVEWSKLVQYSIGKQLKQ